MSNGDGKVLRFPVERVGKAPDLADMASPETLAGTIAELARGHPALKVTVDRILAVIKGEQDCARDEDVARTADHMIAAYGSIADAIVKAQRIEEASELFAFARAVRAELERRAADVE